MALTIPDQPNISPVQPSSLNALPWHPLPRSTAAPGVQTAPSHLIAPHESMLGCQLIVCGHKAPMLCGAAWDVKICYESTSWFNLRRYARGRVWPACFTHVWVPSDLRRRARCGSPQGASGSLQVSWASPPLGVSMVCGSVRAHGQCVQSVRAHRGACTTVCAHNACVTVLRHHQLKVSTHKKLRVIRGRVGPSQGPHA